jgi:GGDEF domain-containing protein
MKKNKEDKLLERFDRILEDFTGLYSEDGIVVQEYKYLLKEYKKLKRRFDKSIKMGDSFGMAIIKDNDKLKDNVTYAINLGRDKLQHNIEEHKKTKEQFQLYMQKDKQIINDLKEELSNMCNLSDKPEQTTKSKDNPLDIIEISNSDINEKRFFEKRYDDILSEELSNAKAKCESITVAKISIDRFDKLQHQFTTEKINPFNILKGLYRFFLTNVDKKDIVYYSHNNIYYMVFKDMSLEKVKTHIEKINVTKKIGILTISFSIGVTRYKSDDTIELINKRCDMAHENSQKISTEGSVTYS